MFDDYLVKTRLKKVPSYSQRDYSLMKMRSKKAIKCKTIG